MDASASAQPPDHSHRDAKHRRPQLHNLNVQVPTAPATNVGCFSGCFRPSPTSSSSSSPSAHSSSYGHGGLTDRPASPSLIRADRPASPSLIRSPSAWIKAKGQTFGSSAKHARRRSRDTQYDALSYARNFDEGGTDGEGEEEAAGDALRHRCFASRLPGSPTPAESPKGLATGGGGNGKAREPARETTGRDLEE